MVTREEMLIGSEVSGCIDTEMEVIYQIGDDAPIATFSAYCNGIATIICC